jgi:hypothetical protein
MSTSLELLNEALYFAVVNADAKHFSLKIF